MNYNISQLHIEDYDEAIDFINMVFSMDDCPTNFLELLPAYYRRTEEHMACHYAVKENGKIRAMLGIYPIELVVDGSALKVARIGAVSTHSYSRNKGMMTVLMNHATNLAKEQGYPVGYLGGLRHRYIAFGYEKCGTTLVFKINQHNLKHQRIDTSDMVLETVITKSGPVIGTLKELHDRQLYRYTRSLDDFKDLCNNWKNKLYAVRANGECKGYLVVTPDNKGILEVVTENDITALYAIYSFVSGHPGLEVSIEVNPLNKGLARLLGDICEVVTVKGAHNWQVFDWEIVVKTLLAFKNKVSPLVHGKTIIGIKDYGNIRLSVGPQGVDCDRCDEKPDITVNTTQAMRLLFGPVSPEYVIELTGDSSILKEWCPLPLAISAPDWA